MDDYTEVQQTSLRDLEWEREQAYEAYYAARTQRIMIENRPDIGPKILEQAEETQSLYHKEYLRRKKLLAMKKFSRKLTDLTNI